MEEIITRYEAGETSYQIAPDYGVYYITILNRLREAGVKVRPRFGNAA
ncbi:MAG: hypothetical protein LC793_05945 [Thermomicrobia bacterium]|nr:hypothetical protein [Thermomicrobia bacterium]